MTKGLFYRGTLKKFLLTRPLRGVTNAPEKIKRENPISTHTPLARRDYWQANILLSIKTFLLTRPLRGVTSSMSMSIISDNISTHTPLARRDDLLKLKMENIVNFYSHAPCEAWLISATQFTLNENFYSHAPCEAWRGLSYNLKSVIYFYSHAPCEAWQKLLKVKLKN